MPNSGSWTRLLEWYDANGRDLPWRRSSDPYAVWVSEVMLQQTQVRTVVKYFERWMRRFPDVRSLAEANPQEALEIWQGLGYYVRCRQMLEGAKWILEQGWPQTRKGWQEVPGVGPYTASAIASMAFGEPVGVVDGNVERVFARLTGCRGFGSKLLQAARNWADQHVSRERPGDWNQALMELGATVCTPKGPACQRCPLSAKCVARQSWTVDELPVAAAKRGTVQLCRAVWVPFFDGRFGVRQIPVGEWAEGLWEFPSSDTTPCTNSSAHDRPAVANGSWEEALGEFTHSVTHHRIKVLAWLLRVESPSDELRWVTMEEIQRLPMPSPQRRVSRLAMGVLGL